MWRERLADQASLETVAVNRSRMVVGLAVVIVGVAIWTIVIASPDTHRPSSGIEQQRYAISSHGTETILLDTGTGETWRLVRNDSEDSELYWSRLPAPGGIAKHQWGASPFTEVRFRGNDVDEGVDVEFNSQQYELVSVNGFTTRTLLEQARHHGGSQSHEWQKYFAEDLASLLNKMGKPAGDAVSLVLKHTTSDELVTIVRAPMTKDNRQEVWHRRNNPAQD